VEEFMLLANISVAEQLFKHFPDTAILRRHPAPPQDNFEALNRALEARNPEFCLDTTSSKSLALSLDKAIDPADPYLNRLVRIMTTRCMLQAQYFASGAHSYAAFWHYGLACPIYTHFTSPIRRYADVLVHRLLHASIDQDMRGSSINWDKSRGEDLCNSTPAFT
jgi:exosome complex exonuclease DIS3/RRP44